MVKSAADIYTPEWVETHRWTNQWSSRVLLCVLSRYYGFIHTHLDVGCNDGHISHLVGKLGIESTGVDIVVPAYDDGTVKLIKHDLSEPFNLGKTFDLVTSWEVAEHIAADKADVFADTIVRHVKKDLVFSAAISGQGGFHHVNEQPYEYWIDKFRDRGLKVLSDKTHSLREQVKEICGPAWWYAKNLLVLVRV